MDSSQNLLDELRRRVRAAEGGYGEPALRRHVPTGIAAIDAELPGGGLPAGSLIEIFERDDVPCGGTTLAVLLAKAALAHASDGGTERIAWVDTRELYVPAAAALGIDLRRLLVVAPRNDAEALWAFEQAARSRAIAASVLAAGRVPLPVVRRLQLAAEAGGGLAFLLRPDAESAQPSVAAVRIRTSPRPRDGETPEGGIRRHFPPRRFLINILKLRGGFVSSSWIAEVCDANGTMHCVAAAGDRKGREVQRGASQ
jgi:cell division inhibitor SulA/protein ImuA